jgi:hypothetical protein
MKLFIKDILGPVSGEKSQPDTESSGYTNSDGDGRTAKIYIVFLW